MGARTSGSPPLAPRTRRAASPNTLEPTIASGIEVPFALALDHLLVASGQLNDLPVTLIVDSGIEEDGGGAFTRLGGDTRGRRHPLPETSPQVGESGAGDVTLELGHFPIRLLALGDVRKEQTRGLYGAFSADWNEVAEFRVHGLVSHHFLHAYAWTIDFARMTMTLVPPAPGRVRGKRPRRGDRCLDGWATSSRRRSPTRRSAPWSSPATTHS